MERTLISWNVANMITVPLMALGGFLLVAVIWQGWLALAANGGGSAPANNSSSF